MKKTLLITFFFPPATGGIENYYANMCRLLPQEKIAVLAQNQPDDADFDRQQNYPIYRADFFAGKIKPSWWQLKKEIAGIVAQEGIEQLAFGHFHPLNVLGDFLRLPYFVFTHGTDISQIQASFWQKFIFKRVYKNCQKIVANSEFLAKQISELVSDQSKIEKIYPGVDADFFSRPLSDFEERKKTLGLAGQEIILLSVGRLVKEKQFDLIIKMMPTLWARIPDLKYFIVGGGPEETALKNLVGQMALADKVKFCGEVATDSENKVFYYQLAKAFVTVSLKPEGFGVSYLEAQAAGLPVVASKFGGSAEAVVDGQTGLLVDPANADEAAAAVYRLLSDDDLREKFSLQGKDRVQREFTWPRQAEKIIRLLS